MISVYSLYDDTDVLYSGILVEDGNCYEIRYNSATERREFQQIGSSILDFVRYNVTERLIENFHYQKLVDEFLEWKQSTHEVRFGF